MVATPFTRPPGSDSTIRPINMLFLGTISLPPTTIGSANETSKVSPTFWSFVEIVFVVRTFNAVPASSTTGLAAAGRAAAGAAAVFAGLAGAGLAAAGLGAAGAGADALGAGVAAGAGAG